MKNGHYHILNRVIFQALVILVKNFQIFCKMYNTVSKSASKRACLKQKRETIIGPKVKSCVAKCVRKCNEKSLKLNLLETEMNHDPNIAGNVYQFILETFPNSTLAQKWINIGENNVWALFCLHPPSKFFEGN